MIWHLFEMFIKKCFQDWEYSCMQTLTWLSSLSVNVIVPAKAKEKPFEFGSFVRTNLLRFDFHTHLPNSFGSSFCSFASHWKTLFLKFPWRLVSIQQHGSIWRACQHKQHPRTIFHQSQAITSKRGNLRRYCLEIVFALFFDEKLTTFSRLTLVSCWIIVMLLYAAGLLQKPLSSLRWSTRGSFPWFIRSPLFCSFFQRLLIFQTFYV